MQLAETIIILRPSGSRFTMTVRFFDKIHTTTNRTALTIAVLHSTGKRLANFRKQRGYTQVELAEQIGIIQSLISDYERERLRPHAEMIIRFSIALGVSTDELLGVVVPDKKEDTPKSRRILRRLKKIESLPRRDQEALLRTIDAFLVARKAS